MVGRGALDLVADIHGNGKPLVDCTLHIVGVRATMALEGLTRGFDPAAKDSVARMISLEAGVPRDSVSLLNTRTVGGHAGYVVGDCRSRGCSRYNGSPETAVAVEFDVVINTNDALASQVAAGFEHINNETDPNVLRRLTDALSASPSDVGSRRRGRRGRATTDDDDESVLLVLSVTNIAAEDTAADALYSPECAPGEMLIQGVCDNCPAGTHSDGSDELCFQCPDDHHAPQPGSPTCTPCPPGLFQRSDGVQCTRTVYGSPPPPEVSFVGNQLIDPSFEDGVPAWVTLDQSPGFELTSEPAYVLSGHSAALVAAGGLASQTITFEMSEATWPTTVRVRGCSRPLATTGCGSAEQGCDGYAIKADCTHAGGAAPTTTLVRFSPTTAGFHCRDLHVSSESGIQQIIVSAMFNEVGASGAAAFDDFDVTVTAPYCWGELSFCRGVRTTVGGGRFHEPSPTACWWCRASYNGRLAQHEP